MTEPGLPPTPRKSKLRKWLVNLLLLCFSTTLALVIAELCFRWMLFGTDSFQSLKNPGSYASVLSEDYWLLEYRWSDKSDSQYHPHPLLGWTGHYNDKNYAHSEFYKSRGKRPVLLYGDSFSQCMPAARCFQDILNADSAFFRGHCLLNYGTGGYGLDQIYLLYKQTAHRYKDPFIVFGFLTSDLDRCILRIRSGLKPWFSESGDSLQLNGVPVTANIDSFLSENQPDINSYLWRRFLSSKFNFLPESVDPRVKGDRRDEARIRSLNEKLMEKIIADLKNSGNDFVFLVFHEVNSLNRTDDSGNWRDTFLLRILDRHQVPYIWTHKLVTYENGKFNHDQYLLSDGHPTTYFNTLISDEIKKQVLTSKGRPDAFTDTLDTRFFENEIRKTVNEIRNSKEWLGRIEKDAKEKGKDLDQALWENAVYVLLQQ